MTVQSVTAGMKGDPAKRFKDVLDARKRLPAPAVCRAIRESAGVSVRELAVLLDVTPTCVSYWELGRRKPKSDHLVRYVAALDLMRDDG